MGACICKDVPDTDEYVGNIRENITRARGLGDEYENYLSARSGSMRWKFPASTTVDKLVLETLNVVGSLVEKFVLLFIIFNGLTLVN